MNKISHFKVCINALEEKKRTWANNEAKCIFEMGCRIDHDDDFIYVLYVVVDVTLG